MTWLPVTEQATMTWLPVTEQATMSWLPVTEQATMNWLPVTEQATMTWLLVTEQATVTWLPVTEHLFHKWPCICLVCCIHNLVLSSLMTYHRVCDKSNTTVSLLEQEQLLTITEHRSSSPVF